MEEIELLDALDRHMRSAAARLDAAIGDEPGEPFAPPTMTPRRPWRPLLAAAVIVVVALVGALFVLGGGDGDGEESTVAGQPDQTTVVPTEPTRLGLADPAAAGFELYAALDGPTSVAGAPTGELSAQSPAGAEDPWASSVFVVSNSTPEDPQMYLKGEVVDIGTDAVIQPIGPGTTIAWLGDGVIHRIGSTRLTATSSSMSPALPWRPTTRPAPSPASRCCTTGRGRTSTGT